MKNFLAILGVIFIWTTTPLAIKWSSESVGFVFAVTSRMMIGVVAAMILLRLLSMPFPWNKSARRTYFAAASGIYAAMMLVYWAAQFIPSGLVSVVFGAAPMITGLFAYKLLGKDSLTPLKIIGSMLGMAGLIVTFNSTIEVNQQTTYAVLAVLASTLFHTLSAIWVKKINTPISALATTTGAILYALPCYILTWFLLEGTLPTTISTRSLLSIVYLGIVGSVLGFALYFYVLKQFAASRVALFTLITPITCLLLGYYLNNESLTINTWIGAGMVLAGIICHEFIRPRR